MQSFNCQTVTDLPENLVKIKSDDQILLLGSCFSTNIGQRLQTDLVNATINPFGTLFNPISILNVLKYSFGDTQWQDSGRFVQVEDVWVHYDFPATLYGLSKTQLETKIVNVLRAAKTAIDTCDWVFLTFGTALLYSLNHSGKEENWVANCHQQPGSNFTQHLAPMELLIGCLKELKTFFPNKNLVTTLSPVRHTRQGVQNNFLSKSALRQSIYQTNLTYFPSYEIVLDELRDYKWFESDGVHPNARAVDVIYEKVRQSYFSSELLDQTAEWNSLRQMIAHTPKYPESIQYQRFQDKLKEKISNSRFDSIRQQSHRLG